MLLLRLPNVRPVDCNDLGIKVFESIMDIPERASCSLASVCSNNLLCNVEYS